jgi:hypothetical protein
MLKDFDWGFNPKIPRNRLVELAWGRFVAQPSDVLLIGSPPRQEPHRPDRHRAILAGHVSVAAAILERFLSRAPIISYHRPRNQRTTERAYRIANLRRSRSIGDTHRHLLGVAGLQPFLPGRVSTFGDAMAAPLGYGSAERCTSCARTARDSDHRGIRQRQAPIGGGRSAD